MSREEAIRRLAEAAVSVESRFGLPAELVAAQAALESGWLRHAPGNNPFGIKWSPARHDPDARQLLRTREWLTEDQLERWAKSMEGRQVLRRLSGPDRRGRFEWEVRDWFATYPTLTDAFTDYALLLSRQPRYQRVVAAPSWEAAMDAIAESGYATDPEYGRKLRQVMTPEFLAAISEARSTASQALAALKDPPDKSLSA